MKLGPVLSSCGARGEVPRGVDCDGCGDGGEGQYADGDVQGAVGSVHELEVLLRYHCKDGLERQSPHQQNMTLVEQR